MTYRRFTVSGSVVRGFRVSPEGEVSDFSGYLSRKYASLARATAAARRKYHDSSISIVEIEPKLHHFKVDEDQLMAISTQTD